MRTPTPLHPSGVHLGKDTPDSRPKDKDKRQIRTHSLLLPARAPAVVVLFPPHTRQERVQ